MSKGKWTRDPATGASVQGQDEKFADGWLIGEAELNTEIAALQGADMFNRDAIADAAGIRTPDYFVERAVRPAGFEWDVFDRAKEPPTNNLAPGPRFKLFLEQTRPFADLRESEKRDGESDEQHEARLQTTFRNLLWGKDEKGNRLLDQNGHPKKIDRLYRAVGIAAPSSQVAALGAALRHERIDNRAQGRVRARKARQMGN